MSGDICCKIQAMDEFGAERVIMGTCFEITEPRLRQLTNSYDKGGFQLWPGSKCDGWFSSESDSKYNRIMVVFFIFHCDA